MSDTNKKELTYAHQTKLPSLPLPDLEQSCEKYLQSGEYFVSYYSFL